MLVTMRDGCRLHVVDQGPQGGQVVVFANSLGTDLRLWDGVLAHMPDHLRILRYDMRGHGQSDVPDGPYSMGRLVSDAEAILDHLGLRGVTFVGLGIGGMVAQGLAAKRLDLVARLVLSNTAAKIGTPQMWTDRIAAVRAGGMEQIADAVMDRWFDPRGRASPDLALWRARFCAVSPEGYVGCCAAISGTDLYTPTSGLRLPTLMIAGARDGATPPDLVSETGDLIPGSRFALIRHAGHLPSIDAPEDYARIVMGFL